MAGCFFIGVYVSLYRLIECFASDEYVKMLQSDEDAKRNNRQEGEHQTDLSVLKPKIPRVGGQVKETNFLGFFSKMVCVP